MTKRIILSIAVLLFVAGGVWVACNETTVAPPAAPSATTADKGWTAAGSESSASEVTVEPGVQRRHALPTPILEDGGGWKHAARTRVALVLLREAFANLSTRDKRRLLDRMERNQAGTDYKTKAREAILSDVFPMFELHDNPEVRKYKLEIEKELRSLRGPSLPHATPSDSSGTSSERRPRPDRFLRGSLLFAAPPITVSPISAIPSCNASLEQHCEDIAAAQAEAAYWWVYFGCWLGTWTDGVNHNDCDLEAETESQHEYEFVRDECLEDHNC